MSTTLNAGHAGTGDLVDCGAPRRSKTADRAKLLYLWNGHARRCGGACGTVHRTCPGARWVRNAGLREIKE
jgi:hypothetical protein